MKTGLKNMMLGSAALTVSMTRSMVAHGGHFPPPCNPNPKPNLTRVRRLSQNNSLCIMQFSG